MSAPHLQSALARGRSASVQYQHRSTSSRSRSESTSRSSATSTSTYHLAYRHYAATFNNQTRDVLDSDVDEIDAMLRALSESDGEEPLLQVQDEGFIGSRSLSSSTAKSLGLSEVNQTVGEVLNTLRTSHVDDGGTTIDIVIRFALQLMESKRDQVSPAEAVRRDEYIRPIEPSTLTSFLTSTLFPSSPLTPVLTSSNTARQCIAYLALEHYYLTQEAKGLADLLQKANELIKYHETQRAVLEMRCERVETERDALARLVGEYEKRMARDMGFGGESRVELLVEDQEVEERGRRGTNVSTATNSRAASPFRSLLSGVGPATRANGLCAIQSTPQAEVEAEEEDQYLLSDLHLSSMQESTRTISHSPILDLIDFAESASNVNTNPSAPAKVLADTFLAAISAPTASSSSTLATPSSDLAAHGSEPAESTSPPVFPTTATTASIPTPAPLPVTLTTHRPLCTEFAVTVSPQRTRRASLCAYARAVNAAAGEVRRLSERISAEVRERPAKVMREARDSGCVKSPEPGGLMDVERATRACALTGDKIVDLLSSALCAKCLRLLQAQEANNKTKRATAEASVQAAPLGMESTDHNGLVKLQSQPTFLPPGVVYEAHPSTSCPCDDDDDPCFSDAADSDSGSDALLDLMAFPRTVLSPFGSSHGRRHHCRSRSRSDDSDVFDSDDEPHSFVAQVLTAPWACVKRQAQRVVARVKEEVDEWLVV